MFKMLFYLIWRLNIFVFEIGQVFYGTPGISKVNL